MEATGYRPSMQAQMLRTRRTRQIGVIMPRLSSESCARMVEGISRVLDEQGYQLLLVNTAYLVDGSFNPFLYFRF